MEKWRRCVPILAQPHLDDDPGDEPGCALPGDFRPEKTGLKIHQSSNITISGKHVALETSTTHLC